MWVLGRQPGRGHAHGRNPKGGGKRPIMSSMGLICLIRGWEGGLEL